MPFENPYNEPELISLLANDSEDAFKALFYYNKDIVYQTALQYTKLPALAEEIVQDVFMKVWFNRHKLADIDNFRGWLYTISKNHILNSLHKIACEARAVQRIAENSISYEDNGDFKLRNAEYHQLLHRAVEALPRQQQQIFKMVRDQRLSYKTIATLLGISVMTVKTHMGRALHSIRHYLRKHGALFWVVSIFSAS
ncbi:MAG: RNA polymerase sigma factor [Agriterribacter sp.]